MKLEQAAIHLEDAVESVPVSWRIAWSQCLLVGGLRGVSAC